MRNINFSKQIYERNVFLGCSDILRKMMSEVSEDQTYRINTDNPITPEIPAILLKAGFNLEIFLSYDGHILNSLFISCKKDHKEGVIKRISNSGLSQDESEKYREAIEKYMNSEESKDVLKKLEKSLG